MKRVLQKIVWIAGWTVLLLVILPSGHAFAQKGKPKPLPPSDPAIACWVGTPSTGTGGDMMVMNADGPNQTIEVPDGANRPVSPSWSPDGQSLVYSHLFNGNCRDFMSYRWIKVERWGAPSINAIGEITVSLYFGHEILHCEPRVVRGGTA